MTNEEDVKDGPSYTPSCCPEDCNTKSEYKPLGLKESKQKSEAIASLLGILLLEVSPPQANLSVARAILNFFLRHLG